MIFRRARQAGDPAGPGAPGDPGVPGDPAASDGGTARRGAGGPIWNDRLGRWSTRSLQVLIVIALAALAIWALVQVKLLVIPVLIAIILAAAAASAHAVAAEPRGMAPILAAWITLLGGILVLGAVVTLIVLAVRTQWPELLASAYEGFDDLVAWLQTLPLPIDQQQINAARDAIVDFFTSPEFGTGGAGRVRRAAEVLTGALLLFVVVLFFLLKDGERIWEFFLRPFRGDELWQRGRRIGETSVKVLGGYLRGTAVIAFVDAAAIGIGLAILQVPLALPLAVIVFLAAPSSR